MKILNRAVGNLRNRVLAYLLPRHMKRILFLMALYQSSIKGDEVTEVELEELNRFLKLARTNSAALRFPCTLAKERFPDLTCVSVAQISDEEIQQLLAKLPDWIKYARLDDLKKDVRSLRQFAAEHA